MITLTLIDFLADPLFNSLRLQMNAPLVKSPNPTRIVKLLDDEAIYKLGKEGIDVDFGDVRVEPDGTLSYKGKRVVLYIRDVAQFTPRFHVSYCTQLEKMRQSNRWTRYVVATRDDGKFQINRIVGRSGPQPSIEQLNVCQYCLGQIGWDNFSYSSMSRSARFNVVNQFTLTRFFEKFPKDLISVIPTHNADVAPLNDYTDDWGLIAERKKKERGYTCERCHISLQGGDAKYLHAHHDNGQKNDNSDLNLKILCISCHASEPMHAHMRATAALREFEVRFGNRCV